MPDKDLSQYLTIGELAALYEIPKQTLIYYATNGIIKPAFVNENGYRYYSVNEFLALEIILNLRKLDIKSSSIKDFVFERTTENIVKILTDKKQQFQQQIEDLTSTINNINIFLDGLKKQDDLITDVFQTLQLPEQLIVVSPPFDENSSPSRIPEFAHHNQQVFPRTVFRSFPTGWIISQENFFDFDNPYHSKQYFTPLPPGCQLKNVRQRPAGLYVLMNFRGSFYAKCHELRKKLADYLKCNNLTAIDDIYILPVKNHWQTDNSKDFITQLSVRVNVKKI